MTEKEHRIEMLCIEYSLEALIEQRKKVVAGTEGSIFNVIDAATMDELDQAIADYDKEYYRHMREEVQKVERDHNIEVLCTGHSLKDLKQQLRKKYDGIEKNEQDMLENAFWDSISMDELKEAISRYDEENYKQIREEIIADAAMPIHCI